jgi:hypothetical protein
VNREGQIGQGKDRPALNSARHVAVTAAEFQAAHHAILRHGVYNDPVPRGEAVFLKFMPDML